MSAPRPSASLEQSFLHDLLSTLTAVRLRLDILGELQRGASEQDVEDLRRAIDRALGRIAERKRAIGSSGHEAA